MNTGKIGRNSVVFELRYRKIFSTAQPIKVSFKFAELISVGVVAYALILADKLLSISSDG